MKQKFICILALAGLTVLAHASAAGAACESLAFLELPDTTITLAQTVTDGQFTPPTGARITGLPVFCRVAGVIRPTKDSEIGFEVWMPQENWSGRFVGGGNSGFGGTISYDSWPLVGAAPWVGPGSALAWTDTGHLGKVSQTDWALGHPERVIDYAYRSVHLMTVQAKAIISAYYGKPAAHSYWLGCSCGGDQGLALAQRYPADYDGIIAGAPTPDLVHAIANGIWILNAMTDPASTLTAPAAQTLYQSTIKACDQLDGVRDGVIEDPQRCRPDLASITCKGGNTTDCLTEAQVAAARKLYSGSSNPRTGEMISPGFPPGSELEWQQYARNSFMANTISREFFNNFAFDDPDWNWRTFDFDYELSFADGKVAIQLNANSPDLRTFRALGHKLLQWHGWEDYWVSPFLSIQYYESVQAVFGAYHANGSKAPANTDDFYRLFMIPGLRHCTQGPGVNSWTPMQSLPVIIDWVENGKAPDRILGATRDNKGVTFRTRPLCPYPKVARWTGAGNPDNADNFVCSVPDKTGQ